MSHLAPLWTIAELGSAAEQALAVGYDGQRNGQVRDVPDPRTIRYYASLGLVDPPAEMRGRTAYYCRRHLLQLVAVKRLQAAGKSLVEVQQALVGITNAALEKLANVAAEAGPPPTQTSASPPRSTAFWATPPAPVSPVRTVQVLTLSPGVSLMLDTAAELSLAEISAIRTAAGPLLKMLESRTATSPHPTPEDS